MSDDGLNKVQHTETVRDYFQTRADDYDAFYDAETGLHRWFNRTFRKAVYLRRDQVIVLARRFGCESLLDVGCGSGRNTIWWARQGVQRVHGVDFSEEMIRQAQDVAREAQCADRCTFEVADFLRWNSSTPYDLVAACGVFDYVIDAEALLRHMARHARKVIYGSFPGWTLVRTPLRKLRYWLRGCPTHFYRRREIERLFKSVGFGTTEILPIGAGYLAWAARP